MAQRKSIKINDDPIAFYEIHNDILFINVLKHFKNTPMMISEDTVIEFIQVIESKKFQYAAYLNINAIY